MFYMRCNNLLAVGLAFVRNSYNMKYYSGVNTGHCLDELTVKESCIKWLYNMMCMYYCLIETNDKTHIVTLACNMD